MPATDVLRALTTEAYLRDGMSELPDVSVKSVQQQRSETTVENTLHLLFRGSLPSIVTTIVAPDKLGWIEQTHITLSDASARFTISPTNYSKYFRCSGTWTIVASTGSGGGSRRIIEGSMKVTSPLPFVNGQAERAIVSGLRERLEKEPQIVETWLKLNPA